MIRSMIIVEVGECADHLTIITAAKCGNLRLIHTCRSGLRQRRDRNFSISVAQRNRPLRNLH